MSSQMWNCPVRGAATIDRGRIGLVRERVLGPLAILEVIGWPIATAGDGESSAPLPAKLRRRRRS